MSITWPGWKWPRNTRAIVSLLVAVLLTSINEDYCMPCFSRYYFSAHVKCISTIFSQCWFESYPKLTMLMMLPPLFASAFWTQCQTQDQLFGMGPLFRRLLNVKQVNGYIAYTFHTISWLNKKHGRFVRELALWICIKPRPYNHHFPLKGSNFSDMCYLLCQA